MPPDVPDPDSLILSGIFIFILVLLSGFFSATETAFSSLNKTKLKLKAQAGNKSAQNALDLSEKFDKLLSAILVGNNLVNITLSVLFNKIIETLIPNPAISAVVSVAVSTVIVLTFGEITPKMIAKENSERIAMAFGYPIRFVMIVLFPITILFSGLKLILRKLFNGLMDGQFLCEKFCRASGAFHLMLIEVVCLLHIFPAFQPGQDMKQFQHFQPKIACIRHRMYCVKLRKNMGNGWC